MHITYLFSFILLCGYVLAENNEEDFTLVRPENLSKSATIQELIKMVKQHNFNVTILNAAYDFWFSGDSKRVLVTAFNFPNKNVQTEIKTKYQNDKKEFLKTATSDGVTAITRRVTYKTENGVSVVDDYKEDFNNKDGVADNNLWHSFPKVTTINEGAIAINWEKPAVMAKYNFTTLGADGKSKSTFLYFDNVKVRENMRYKFTSDELEKVIQTVEDMYILFESKDDAYYYVTQKLNKLLPDWTWETLKHPEFFNVPSEKYVLLNINDEETLLVNGLKK